SRRPDDTDIGYPALRADQGDRLLGLELSGPQPGAFMQAVVIAEQLFDDARSEMHVRRGNGHRHAHPGVRCLLVQKLIHPAHPPPTMMKNPPSVNRRNLNRLNWIVLGDFRPAEGVPLPLLNRQSVFYMVHTGGGPCGPCGIVVFLPCMDMSLQRDG